MYVFHYFSKISSISLSIMVNTLNFTQLKKYKGIIFDLDGTLVDSMPLHIQAWEKTLLDYNIVVNTAWLYAHGGVPSFKIARSLINEFDNLKSISEEQLAKNKNKNYLETINQVKIFPEILNLIKFFKQEGMPMAIGTGTLRTNAEYIVNNTELRNYISVIVSADDVVNHKPHPDTFIEASRRIGVSPNHSLVFEDTPLGIEAAIKGGFNTILVENGIPKLNC